MSLKYFPANYSEARTRFLDSINKLKGKHDDQSWVVPCETDADLYVDTVYLPPSQTTKSLFIIISGTHGLEGYAGSGIQQLCVQEYLDKVDRTETGFLLVHSLNPYGFKYHRRGTENGVNLNRNCSIYPSFFETANLESLGLTNKFIPGKPVDSETCYMVSRAKHLGQNEVEFDGVSLDQFVKVIGLGQFHDAKGLEFGGKNTEPQIASFIAQLKNLVPQYSDIIQLDLHTGLGERGRLHILVDGQVEGLHPQLFSELLVPKEDAEIYAFTDSTVPGFYKTRGATNNLIAELVNANQRACALTLEFGTLGHDLNAQLEALNSWLLEHQGSCHGYATPELEGKVKQLYLERFFPSAPNWGLSVLSASREFFKTVFQRSGILTK